MRLPKNQPVQLSLHRYAVQALYRALHRSLSPLNLPADDHALLTTTLRTRFRVSRPSRLKLRLAIRAGYTALDILDGAADGDPSAQEKLGNVIKQLRAREAEMPPVQLSSKPEKKKGPTPPQEPGDALAKFWPRPHVTGIRKVPFMVSANGLPMLRLGKPQPAKLSGTLASLLKTRQRRWDTISRLDEEAVTARLEDDWENMVRRLNLNSEDGEDKTSKYAESVELAKREIFDRIYAAESRAKRRVEVMTDIILKERELAEQERKQREKEKTGGM